MRSRIVRIGSSHGVRIPRPLLEQAGLGEEIHLTVEGNSIVIRAASSPRAGWAAAFAELAASADDRLLDGPLLEGEEPTSFDDEEWEW